MRIDDDYRHIAKTFMKNVFCPMEADCDS